MNNTSMYGPSTKTLNFILILFLSLVLSFVGCDQNKKTSAKKKNAENTLKYTNFVGGYTSGSIKRKSTIRVNLRNTVEDHIVNALSKEKFFSISPPTRAELFLGSMYRK